MNIDSIITSPLINQSALAAAMGTTKQNLNAKINNKNGRRLTNMDRAKIREIINKVLLK